MWQRGSLWRKWDLHVHIPGTCRENGYGDPRPAVIDRFCEILAESDVDAIGLTDYFRLERVFGVIDRYRELHPERPKLLIPNLELRVAADGANPKGEAHVLFDPALGWQTIRNMLARIEARYSEPGSGTVTCHLGDFAHATVPDGLQVVDMATVAQRIGEARRHRTILVAVCGDDGMSFAVESALEKTMASGLRDNCEAAFGNPTDAARHAREREGGSPWRGPVFAGSDCHSFEDLERRLGRSIQGSHRRDSHVTWIKSAVSWDGLKQTLADPDSRVHLGPTPPMTRRAGRVIDSIQFASASAYPSHQLTLNPGLVAIIGSRSSGKSSLLAQIAHQASPAATSAQLARAGRPDGPSAGYAWTEGDVTLRWADGSEGLGPIVYVPQDFIHRTAEDQSTVTKRLRNILRKDYEELHVEWQQLGNSAEESGAAITRLARQLFDDLDRVEALRRTEEESETLESLQAGLENAQRERDLIDAQFALDEQQSAALSDYRTTKANTDVELARTVAARQALATAGATPLDQLSGNVRARVDLDGLRLGDVPQPLAGTIQEILARHAQAIRLEVGEAITAQIDAWNETVVRAAARLQASEDRAGSALEQVRASSEHTERADTQIKKLRSAIDARERHIGLLDQAKSAVINRADELQKAINSRRSTLDAFSTKLSAANVFKASIQVSAEVGFELAQAAVLTEKLDGRSRAKSRYLTDDGFFAFEAAQSDARRFIEDLRAQAEGLRLKRNAAVVDVAAEALATAPTLHLVGEMDGDRIGGFAQANMSPGKAAQFSFELIVAAADEDCPILLDQPEDDLDSQSIIKSVLPRLRELRQTRQVLVVTHNANLVVGGDADQIIVAERKQSDHGGYLLNYEAGPFEIVENSEGSGSGSELIRDRVCSLLDGGVPAMERRLERYQLAPKQAQR